MAIGLVTWSVFCARGSGSPSVLTKWQAKVPSFLCVTRGGELASEAPEAPRRAGLDHGVARVTRRVASLPVVIAHIPRAVLAHILLCRNQLSPMGGIATET